MLFTWNYVYSYVITVKMPKHEKDIESETVVLAEVTTETPKKVSLKVRRPEAFNEPTVHARLSSEDAITTEWVVGEKYELQNVELKSRTGNDFGYFFSSYSETSINRLTYDAFDFLVVGDTHFGYENRRGTGSQYRTQEGPDSRYSDGYEFDALGSVVTRAEKWDVDAIFHTGDIFDNTITRQQYSIVENAFQGLAEVDVDIFFVPGNHDENAKSEISSISTLPNVTRIDKRSNWGAVSGFNVIGQASSDLTSLDEFSWVDFENKHDGPNILIAHPEDTPPFNAYKLNKLEETIDDQWILFLGHYYEEDTYELGDVQVIFTGFPAKLDDGGSVWRIRGGNGEYSVSRHTL